jgi:hypothetical protein
VVISNTVLGPAISAFGNNSFLNTVFMNAKLKIMTEVMRVKRLSEFATIPSRGSVHAAGMCRSGNWVVCVVSQFGLVL